MTNEEFEELNERMLARFFALNPDCATIFGKHVPYDQHLPHGGFKRVADTVDLLTEWNTRAKEVTSGANLTPDEQISLEVLKVTLELHRFVVEDYPLWRMLPNAFESPGSAMLMMIVRDYAPMEQRLEWMASRVGELPRYMREFRERFKGSQTVRLWTVNAIEACRGFPSFLDTAQKLAKEKASPEVSRLMEDNIEAIKSDLPRHEEWLNDLLESSIPYPPMGREKFEKLLKIRGFSLSPDDMEKLATNYLSTFKERRRIIARGIAANGKVESARQIIEADSPKTIEEIIDKNKKVTEEAKRFIFNDDIVTVKKDSNVVITRTPAFMEVDVPSAATFLPAVFEECQDTIYLITPPKNPEDIKSMWNNSAIVNTVVHEAYPGHHLQGVLSNRKPWMHQLPHIVYSPETLSPPYESQEGWAHYCEVMMLERGFCDTVQDEFTMLDYAILRACRVFLDVRLATGKSDVSEIVNMLNTEMGMPEDCAHSEVVGFSRTPGYGICYLIGRHMVMELKQELKQKLGPRFSEKRFHDLVAENGNLPFYLARSAVVSGMSAG